MRIAFLNLDSVSRLRTDRLRLFHSLIVAETKESLVKDSLQNGTIRSLPHGTCVLDTEKTRFSGGHFQQYFSYIVEVSFIGTRRKPLTCRKSLTNLISQCCIEHVSS